MAHSSDSNPHNVTRKGILSTLNLAKILIRMIRMKIRAKTLRDNFRMKATADEVDVTTKSSFSEDKNGQTQKAKVLLIGGKGKR